MRSYVETAWRGQLSSTLMGSSTSTNHRLETPLGSVQSNLIFDGADTLPKEVMLETTLRVLDFRQDIFEVWLTLYDDNHFLYIGCYGGANYLRL